MHASTSRGLLDDDSIGTVSSAFATLCLLLEVIVVEDKHD